MGAALVTGVGRRAGIGFAVARRLRAAGERLVVASWAPHDREQPWGGDAGQHRGPMPGEVAYALSKAALQGITATLAEELAPRGIAVTCVNPGPTDTGWADAGAHGRIAAAFPSGRWTTPDEIAALVEWLTGRPACS